jgi:hypothetical protein
VLVISWRLVIIIALSLRSILIHSLVKALALGTDS